MKNQSDLIKNEKDLEGKMRKIRNPIVPKNQILSSSVFLNRQKNTDPIEMDVSESFASWNFRLPKGK